MTKKIVYMMIAVVALMTPRLVLAQATPTDIELQKPPTDANVFGDVKSDGEHIPYANVYVKGTNIGTSTDETGHYTLINLPEGKHTLIAKFIGYKDQKNRL